MKKILYMIALALSAVSGALAADNGAIAAGRGTPKIDGKLDDAVWRDSIGLAPFILQQQRTFAAEQTTVRLLWDDEHLYVGFHCRERALEPSENKLHAFKRDFHGRDNDAIYRDDMVEILLWNPETPESVSDLAVNANGAVADSISSTAAPDLWSSRSRDWDARAQIAVTLDCVDRAGGWNVELAIPGSALGGRAPGRNAKWKMLAARWAQNSGEKSALQPVRRHGIHDFCNLSELRFVEAVPGVTLKQMPAFAPGRNTLLTALNTGRARMPLEVASTLKFASRPERTRTLFAKTPHPDAPLNFEIRQSGEFTFQWSVASSATLETFFQSPVYTMAVNSCRLDAELSAAELTVNGKPVSKQAMLVSGVNDLVVRTKSPSGVRLSVGGMALAFPDGWKKTGDVYRLGLLADDSVIWPNWAAAGGVGVNRGGIQQILFRPQGVSGMVLDDYTMFFDLPEGFSSPGASGYYGIYPLDFRRVGTVEYAGKNFTRYAVTVRKKLPFNPQLKSHESIAFLLAAPETGAAGEFTAYYHAASAAAGLREIPNPLKIKLLPKLNGTAPRQLRTQLWTGWLSTLDNKSLYPHYRKLFKDAGINEIRSMDGKDPALKEFTLIGFAEWNFSCKPYLAANPGTARMDSDRRESDLYVCSTEMVENPRFAEYFRTRLPEWYEKMGKPDHVNWDYESKVTDSYLACYCPKCLTAFTRRYKLPEPATPELIRTRYFREWTEFMDRRMAEVATLMRDAIRARLPKVIFSIYSGYQSEESKHFYGVDWSMLNGNIDLAMMGYGRNPDELAASRHALPNTPMLLGAIVYPYRFEERIAPDSVTAARLLRRACDATAGWLIYEYSSLDGRTFSAVSEVSKIMADHEAFFKSGIRAPGRLRINGFDQADCEVLEDGAGNVLIALMNPGATARSYQFEMDLPNHDGLLNAKTGQAVKTPVAGTLPAGGVAVFISQKKGFQHDEF